jgi:hypothetical protein
VKVLILPTPFLPLPIDSQTWQLARWLRHARPIRITLNMYKSGISSIQSWIHSISVSAFDHFSQIYLAPRRFSSTFIRSIWSFNSWVPLTRGDPSSREDAAENSEALRQRGRAHRLLKIWVSFDGYFAKR